MKRMKMTDDNLRSQIENWERQAMGYYGGEIAGEQSKAMDYYLQKPFGTEEEGRSRVVSSDVWDVVEGLTPLILKPFVASDDLVKFNPVGPEDEDAAQQETDYINYIVMQQSDAFNEMVSAVKTGLLQKNAVAMYWWEKSTRTEIERYEGVPDDEFALMIQDEGVEVLEHTETPGEPMPGPDGQMAQGPAMHDCVLRISKPHGEAKYMVIPPEEFRISRDAMSVNPKTARYVSHVTKKTISELRELGYEVADDVADFNSLDTENSEQYLARRQAEESEYGAITVLDPSMREVTFRDSLVRIDFDGDGIAELRRVCMVGRDILMNEEAEEVNYVAWTPYPQPFKFYGRCPADETMEIQLIKSTLWRQSLDNIYTINNNRNFVSNKVNLDDLLDNVIAGVVRVDGDIVGNHVMAAPITPIGGVVQPMIEYLDSAKENRTGFTRYNQGTDANSLNKTATGIRVIAEAGNQRVELVSRAFAEQFMKPLMLGLHGICRRHATMKETIQLRGKWVTINPRDWKKRHDMTVSVGLGNSDKQMQMQAAQLVLQTQHSLIQVPGLVTPANFYNAAAKLSEATGEKSPEKYFSNPAKAQLPDPPDPMENPEFMLKVAESKRADRALDIKAAELKQKAHADHVGHLIEAGKLELAVNVAGIDAQTALANIQIQLASAQAAEVAAEQPQEAPQEAAQDAQQPEAPPMPEQPQETQLSAPNGQA